VAENELKKGRVGWHRTKENISTKEDGGKPTYSSARREMPVGRKVSGLDSTSRFRIGMARGKGEFRERWPLVGPTTSTWRGARNEHVQAGKKRPPWRDQGLEG